MKKSLITLAVISAMPIATAAPEENTFYAGFKTGMGSFHQGVNQFDISKNNGNGFSIKRNQLALGSFVGYQFNQHLSTELGYDFFGTLRGEKLTQGLKTRFKHQVQGTHLSLKTTYPVMKDLDIYVKTGVALTKNTYKITSKSLKTRDHRHKASPLLGAGFEYAFTPNLSARVEYQWLRNTGKIGKNTIKGLAQNGLNIRTYSPHVTSINVGLTYHFGQKVKSTDVATIQKNFAFSSDVLFDYGKAKLHPKAKDLLSKASSDIKALGLSKHSLQVSGHTDRLGKPKANLKLSQLRAENVANYLVKTGQDPEKITAVGYGSTNPITGNACNSVKNRKALIKCLAPDRRVEIHVKGSKKITIISNRY